MSRTAKTNSVRHDLFLVSDLFTSINSPFTSLPFEELDKSIIPPMSVPKIRICPVQISLPGVMKVLGKYQWQQASQNNTSIL
jgi:hypothetical protein